MMQPSERNNVHAAVVSNNVFYPALNTKYEVGSSLKKKITGTFLHFFSW